MRYKDYSHRHGREILQILHPQLVEEVTSVLNGLAPFAHGERKGRTVTHYLCSEFGRRGWDLEAKTDFRTEKENFLDLRKAKIAVEVECSKFEMFFRDFFRMMLLYERHEIDAGIIMTLDEMAYERWQGEAKPYKASRASLQKLIDILGGEYRTVVRVPIWCIGIE